MSNTAPSPTPYSDAITPLLASLKATPAPVEPAPNPPDATPAAGGCYTRDPVTGVTTLVTPSTVQE